MPQFCILFYANYTFLAAQRGGGHGPIAPPLNTLLVSGLSEMLVRRRLSILLETFEAYYVQWNVFLVLTTKNKADDLTRVPKHWLKNSADSVGAVALSANMDFFEHSHNLHHCGINTTMYFARQIDPEVSRDEADRVVKNCR